MTHNPQPNTKPQPQPITSEHPLFRSAYGPRLRVALTFTGPGRTKQSHKDECDINQIMARYLATGMLDQSRALAAQYDDVTGIDYQEAMNIVADAKALFAAFPAAVRSRFDNDPAKLLDFVHNPDNVEESAKMGFLDASKLPEGFGRSAPMPDSAKPATASKEAPAAPAKPA